MGRGLSITAFVFSVLFFIPGAPIVGLILGIIADQKAKKDPHALKGLAIAAVIIGALYVLYFIFVAFLMGLL